MKKNIRKKLEEIKSKTRQEETINNKEVIDICYKDLTGNEIIYHLSNVIRCLLDENVRDTETTRLIGHLVQRRDSVIKLQNTLQGIKS